MGVAESPVIEGAALAALAREAGFDLVGFAKAEPIDPRVLLDWLEAGHHAELDWLTERIAERLDVGRLLPGARTVMALACNYFQPSSGSLLARYARGRDYHATLRDRLRALRRAVRARWPAVKDYGSVDANPVMEKVWAARAGLGTVGKNGCLITPQYGSWVVLSAMVLDAEVAFEPAEPFEVCGRCRRCLDACPTQAIVAERVVDARRCLAYQTIENPGLLPEHLRPHLQQTVFGCDVCQDVCPHNARQTLALDSRWAPRPTASLTARQLASLSLQAWDALAPGTPLMRPGYHAMRRNAVYVLGATHDEGARALLQGLAADQAEPQSVRDAARWALGQLPG